MMAVRYLNKGSTQRPLAGIFRLARVGVVTPFRDGMTRVAKNSWPHSRSGVPVLSRLAGAALEERKARWRVMIRHLPKHYITAWRQSFVQALAGSRAGPR